MSERDVEEHGGAADPDKADGGPHSDVDTRVTDARDPGKEKGRGGAQPVRKGGRLTTLLVMVAIIFGPVVVTSVAAMVASGYLQATLPEDPAPPRRDVVSDYDTRRLDEVAEALQDSPVYTDPYYEGDLAEGERDSLSRRLESLDAEVRIAALSVSSQDESSGEAPVVADRLARTLGEEIGPVVVVVVSDGWAEYSGYQYAAGAFADVDRPYSDSGGGSLGAFMSSIVSTYEADPPNPVADRIPPPNSESTEEDVDPGLMLWGYPVWDGVLGGVIGGMFGPFLGLFIAVAVWIWRGVRKR